MGGSAVTQATEQGELGSRRTQGIKTPSSTLRNSRQSLLQQGKVNSTRVFGEFQPQTRKRKGRGGLQQAFLRSPRVPARVSGCWDLNSCPPEEQRVLLPVSHLSSQHIIRSDSSPSPSFPLFLVCSPLQSTARTTYWNRISEPISLKDCSSPNPPAAISC